MCGITGVIQRHEPVDPSVLGTMTDALRARGPDDRGTFIDRQVGLGHRRLAILDLSPAGRQPMWNEDHTVGVVFNGEIYNAPALRAKLEPRHTFTSQTDTEVLVHLYEEAGENLCRELEGMFAFCIYDQERQRLTCARDRFGEKPLYYVLTEKLFAFASEPKSLYHHPEIRSRLTLDAGALEKYFCYGFVPSPHCLFAPIKKLEPATVATFDVQRWTMTRHAPYWDLPHGGVGDTKAGFSDAETLATVDRRIHEAVNDRLAADVPIGIFLSGGLDSSVIAAYVARGGHSLSAFTIASDDPTIDESPFARRVAEHLGIPFHSFPLTGEAIRRSCEAMFAYLDEPLADAAIFPTAFLAHAARQHVTVAISGDGGDELFGGYLKHRAQHFAEQLGPLARLPIPAMATHAIARQSPAVAQFARHLSVPFPARQFLWGSSSPRLADVSVLLNRTLNHAAVFADAERALARYGGPHRDAVNASLYLDGKILLPDAYNVKTDRATMAASLELRSPYLDTRLAETVSQLPGSMKVRWGESKVLLKKLAARLLPPDVIQRKKKGFGVPLSRWMLRDARDLFRGALATPALADIAQTEHVEKLWREHENGVRDHHCTLFRLAMLGAVLRHTPVRLP